MVRKGRRRVWIAQIVATDSVLRKIGSKDGISFQEVERAVGGSTWLTIHPHHSDRILVDSAGLLIVLALVDEDIYQLVAAFRK